MTWLSHAEAMKLLFEEQEKQLEALRIVTWEVEQRWYAEHPEYRHPQRLEEGSK